VIRIVQSGRLAAVSGMHGRTVSAVKNELTFFRNVIGPSGWQPETMRLFSEDSSGNLLMGAGLIPRIRDFIKKSGLPVSVVEDARHCDPRYRIDPSPLSEPGLVLKEGQFDAIKSILSKDSGVIVAPTGWGKSFCIRLICRLLPDCKIHYLTDLTDLCDQMHAELLPYIPDLGRFGGGIKKGGRVCVVNVESAHHTGYDADVIIGDEIHRLCAQKYMDQLGKYGVNRPCRAYGFTASPVRDDGMHRFNEPIFGPVVVKVSYVAAQAASMVVPIEVRWVRPAIARDPSAEVGAGAEKERLGLWSNYARNESVAEQAKAVADKGQTLVMVSTVEHAYRLKQFLPDFEVCYSPNESADSMREAMVAAGLLDKDEPRMTPTRRKYLRDGFDKGKITKVIATQVWSTGVNFRRLAFLIRADGGAAQTKTTQVAGRLSRTFTGKSKGVLIDFWDDWSPTFVRRSRARFSVYESHGFSQVRPSVREILRSKAFDV